MVSLNIISLLYKQKSQIKFQI